MDRKGGEKPRDAILDMIAKNAMVTFPPTTHPLGINRSAVSKYLKKMQEDGMIKLKVSENVHRYLASIYEKMRDNSFKLASAHLKPRFF